MKPLVILESPFAGKTAIETHDNIAYARRCVKHSLDSGEAPIASHLLYTQPGILDDNVPEDRTLGIEAGLAWLRAAQKSVVYVDRGVSDGMLQGIDRAVQAGVPVHLRAFEHPARRVFVRVFSSADLKPGGETARVIGCCCPAIDNHHGERPRFVSEECYLHRGRTYDDGRA